MSRLRVARRLGFGALCGPVPTGVTLLEGGVPVAHAGPVREIACLVRPLGRGPPGEPSGVKPSDPTGLIRMTP